MSPTTQPSCEVVDLRGPHVENHHPLSVAVVTPDGRRVAWGGDPTRLVVLRSTAKPFQAQALLLSGAAERFAVSDEELALACASHDGLPRHLDRVSAFLDRLGLGPEALDCGGHPPLAALAGHIPTPPAPWSPITNNCSGKHTGMLAASLALGAPVAGYLDPSHPVQQLVADVLADVSGAAPVALAVDGCSAPTFWMPLDALARAFAHLVAPATAPGRLTEGLRRTGDAMRRHPDLIAGPGSLDTVLMERFPGLVAKRGAEGCYGLGLPDSPWGPVGVALKIHDGHGTARDVAVVAVLEHLGLAPPGDPALDPWQSRELKNVMDRPVGRVDARITLETA